jgi:hypothetical protein
MRPRIVSTASGILAGFAWTSAAVTYVTLASSGRHLSVELMMLLVGGAMTLTTVWAVTGCMPDAAAIAAAAWRAATSEDRPTELRPRR